MRAIVAVAPVILLGWLATAAAHEPATGTQPALGAGEVQVAQAWRDKLEALKHKGSKDNKEGAKKEDKDELPVGDCATYPIGCGPGYSNPKLEGIDCGGRSEIGCLCWKNLASEQQCDAYRASKNKK